MGSTGTVGEAGPIGPQGNKGGQGARGTTGIQPNYFYNFETCNWLQVLHKSLYECLKSHWQNCRFS